eukprot:CAMPEP_0170615426 /NCGR_PEP_ID=MMETSP0224-20130122/25328_1 /TAXON_ID=285029 /ORGANISM="Togula jolla, Strain CCCM 725" /LENGTH=175 /DNA_ID=CAMNT_0010941151 /DNA_START=44 /DNA_END=571 /DNA_ORIENTATION=-
MAVLLSTTPLALVDTAIGPLHGARPMLLVGRIFSLVEAIIVGGHFSVSLHMVTDPLSSVLPAISPGIHAKTVQCILSETAAVGGPVREEELALTIFAIAHVLTREAMALRPNFRSLAVLLVIEPFANVLCSGDIVVSSVATCLIHEPLTLVHIAISPDEPAVAIAGIALPLANIS